MEKTIETYEEYDIELHKDILGRQFDSEGNEFYYQPEKVWQPPTIEALDRLIKKMEGHGKEGKDS